MGDYFWDILIGIIGKILSITGLSVIISYFQSQDTINKNNRLKANSQQKIYKNLMYFDG